ncbi:hypothetical protein I79_024367 [Cricetulus griseus]|uniref:Uncharacterized protein n=1 Tax=Cricetulus griseus TaxID=10029 RepID=G3IKG4_CRIGR|nr:hypothetical protein I79_024367 [Cricetulus griseus]
MTFSTKKVRLCRFRRTCSLASGQQKEKGTSVRKLGEEKATIVCSCWRQQHGGCRDGMFADTWPIGLINTTSKTRKPVSPSSLAQAQL